jgi:hypothetical protein
MARPSDNQTQSVLPTAAMMSVRNLKQLRHTKRAGVWKQSDVTDTTQSTTAL